MIMDGCQGKPRTPTIREKTCLVCGNTIEIFSTDTQVACDKCGFVAYNDALSCVQWCQYARKCVGDEMYERMMEIARRQKAERSTKEEREMTVAEQKAALRKKLRTMERILPQSYRDESAAAICRRVTELPEYQACIYGLSYWHKEITDGLYDALRPKDPAKINILLAHGGDAKHIPMSEAALRQNGFDYVACGHIHKGGQIIKNKAVMAGSLEPTDCNDFGPHGYWMGEVTKRGCEVSFYPIRKCEYVRHEIRVDAGMTAQDVEECLKRDLAKKEPYEKYHVILTGGYTPGAEPDTARLLELPDVAAVENCLVPAYDFAQLKREYRGTLLERYISKIEALPQNAVTKEALYYGVDAICQAMEHR